MTTRRRWLLPAVAILAARGTLAGCSTNDALLGTTDAGIPDAAAAHPDAAPPLDSPDASPFIGTWTPLPNNPPGCDVRIAADPALSAPKLVWGICQPSRPGCQMLTIDPDSPGSAGAELGGVLLKNENGIPILRYAVVWGDPESEPSTWIDVVQRLDGPVLFAETHTTQLYPRCDVSIYVGDYGLALGVRSELANGSLLVASAPWASLSPLATHVVHNADVGLSVGGFLEDITVTKDHLFLAFDETFRDVAIFDPVTFAMTLADRPDASRYDILSPLAVPDGALTVTVRDDVTDASFNETALGSTLHVDGTHTDLMHASPGSFLQGFGIDADDGSAFVWEEAAVIASTRVTSLWTSPYAATAGALLPRKFAQRPLNTSASAVPILVNAGAVLESYGEGNPIILTRISDGAGWTISDPMKPDIAAWVDHDSVWILNVAGLEKIDRASLPAPDLPAFP